MKSEPQGSQDYLCSNKEVQWTSGHRRNKTWVTGTWFLVCSFRSIHTQTHVTQGICFSRHEIRLFCSSFLYLLSITPCSAQGNCLRGPMCFFSILCGPITEQQSHLTGVTASNLHCSSSSSLMEKSSFTEFHQLNFSEFCQPTNL